MLYHLDWISGNTVESHAPPPPMEAGLAQGGQMTIEVKGQGPDWHFTQKI
jgi:hypothetical protein